MDTKRAMMEWEDWSNLLEVPDSLDAAFTSAIHEVDRLTEENKKQREALDGILNVRLGKGSATLLRVFSIARGALAGVAR